MRQLTLFFLSLLFVTLLPLQAQTLPEDPAPLRIDFADFPAENRPETGWFTLDADGAYAALIQPGGVIVVGIRTGELVATYRINADDGELSTVLDVAFAPEGSRLAAVHDLGEESVLVIFDWTQNEYEVLPLAAEGLQDSLIWWAASEEALWLENTDSAGHSILRYNLPAESLAPNVEIPVAPLQDPTAIARNGRTQRPRAITTDATGLIRQWNLQTEAITGAVQLDNVPRFSRFNDGDGQTLALHDPVANTLQWLDFEAGVARTIAPLSVDLIALHIVPGSGEILGVGVDGAREIGLWDAESGGYTRLGDYRADCTRLPDMVRVSADGARLVIACDAGLEVWTLPNAGVISAANMEHLQSVQQIDLTNVPVEAGSYFTGNFRFDAAGHIYTTYNSDGAIIVWNDESEILFIEDSPGDIYDMPISDDGETVATLRGRDGEIIVTVIALATGDTQTWTLDAPGMPQLAWFSDDSETLYAEVFDDRDTMTQVYALNLADGTQTAAPYGPELDLEALVRIGRVMPPYAITSSVEGLVKRWDLPTGEYTASTQVDGGPVVFGQVSPDGRYLVWRDPASAQVSLLDFQTGENRQIADLGGQYLQGWFVPNTGDVIIGVDVDFVPVVVMWDVATGEQTVLGRYRACNRVPDMIMMSEDGRTISIGCDTGIDIWRIGD